MRSQVAATTTAVGMRFIVSLANDGPERKARYGCISGGRTSSSTSLMVSRVSFSMPLLAQTIGVARGSAGAARSITSRVTCEGLAATTSSAPESASARSVLPRTEGGSGSPGRYLGFSCRSPSATATSGSCDQTTTSQPFPASTDASAVPQLPPPMTAARISGTSACSAWHVRPAPREPAARAMSGGAATVRGMARSAKAARVEHVCGRCGYRTARWLGRCPECGEWASIVEEVPGSASGLDAIGIDRVPLESGARLRTGIGELDRALGGGLVAGAAVLLDGEPGSVSQVREVASRLVEWAKRTGTPTLLVGHVTKDGAIAGPRVLEHTVDTVLYFEGDRSHAYRLLRAHKNRFGSTNEIGVFEMKGCGLEEVRNPSALFLAERPRDSSGSAVVA